MSVSVSAEETAAKVLNRTCETLWVLSIIILLYFNSTYQQAPTFTLWTHTDDDSCLWVEEEKSVNEKWRQLTAVPSGLNRDCNGQLPGTIWTWLSIFSGHFRSQSWLFNCFKKRTWECTEVMNVRGLFCVVENDHTAERESFLHWRPAGTSRNKSIFCLLQTKNSRTWCFLSLENFQASIVALAYRAQKEELRPSSRQLLVVFEVVSSDVWRSRGWDQASLGLQMPKFVHAVLCTNVIIYIKCAIICSSRKASPPQISVLFSKTGARRKTGLFPWRGFASSPCVCVLWVVFFFCWPPLQRRYRPGEWSL